MLSNIYTTSILQSSIGISSLTTSLARRLPQESGLVVWKIADLGIARVLRRNAYGVYNARTQIGTEIYMAPEALRVRPLSNISLFWMTLNFSISGDLLLHSCRYVVPRRSNVLLLQQATPLRQRPLRIKMGGRAEHPREAARIQHWPTAAHRWSSRPHCSLQAYGYQSTPGMRQEWQARFVCSVWNTQSVLFMFINFLKTICIFHVCTKVFIR